MNNRMPLSVRSVDSGYHEPLSVRSVDLGKINFYTYYCYILKYMDNIFFLNLCIVKIFYTSIFL